ncbi:MAG: hypothetical protein WA192_02550 [Candidatus Acidiferrales bacterium]
MHVISIAFGSAPAIWQFVFKTEDAAKKAWDEIAVADEAVITDDFGQSARFKAKDIAGRMIENLDMSQVAHVERSLRQQRMQAKFQKAAESDPEIRAAMRGPAVLSPMGMPFNGRGN